MAIDLTNGYAFKDAASASDVYYGYTTTRGAGSGDFVYAIRRVKTVSGVDTVTWTNNNPYMYSSSWNGRTHSFVTPISSLSLTWSATSSGNSRTATFTWSSISGVNKYVVTTKDINNIVLNYDGSVLVNPYGKSWTTDYTNFYRHDQSFLSAGTYSITVSAVNAGGSTSSTATINFT